MAIFQAQQSGKTPDAEELKKGLSEFSPKHQAMIKKQLEEFAKLTPEEKQRGQEEWEKSVMQKFKEEARNVENLNIRKELKRYRGLSAGASIEKFVEWREIVKHIIETNPPYENSPGYVDEKFTNRVGRLVFKALIKMKTKEFSPEEKRDLLKDLNYEQREMIGELGLDTWLEKQMNSSTPPTKNRIASLDQNGYFVVGNTLAKQEFSLSPGRGVSNSKILNSPNNPN